MTVASAMPEPTSIGAVALMVPDTIDNGENVAFQIGNREFEDAGSDFLTVREQLVAVREIGLRLNRLVARAIAEEVAP